MEDVEAQIEKLHQTLAEAGADSEAITDAFADLAASVSDQIMARDDVFSMREIAATLDADLDELRAEFAHLGLLPVDPDAVLFSAVDVELFQLLHVASKELLLPDEGQELVHLIGSSMRALAEAAVASHVLGPERRSVDALESIRLNEQSTELGLVLGKQLPAVFRQHLRQAAESQRRTQSMEYREHRHMSIGFVDLVGFTSLSQSLDPAGLVDLVKTFEARAHELAHVHETRVVKLIGDEVMFAAESVAAAAGYALSLIESFADDTIVPRGGMASGALINLHGDYFGPVVNLAARLVAEAVPGEVLAPAEAVRDQAVASEPAGRRMLRGFDEPIEVASLRFSATPER